MKTLLLKKRYYVISGILFFFIIILFAAPRIARWYIVKNGPEIIGRNISIEKIRINYFTGKLRINDLRLFEADGKTVFVSLRQLKVNIDYFPLFKNEFVFKYISIDDPYIQVMQDGSRFNFSDLIPPPDSTKQVKDTISREPTKYIINNIRIARGFVKYTDIPLNHTIALDSLDLTIPGFIWNSDSTNLDVDFSFVDGGGLYSSLSINQADSTYSVILKLDSLNLGIIEPYVRSSLDISSLGGYLTSDLLIKGSISSILKLFIHGINHIYGFQIRDTLNRTIFSFNDLIVGIDTFQLEKNRIRIDSVILKNPFILFELIDTSNNWMALMKPAPESQVDSVNRADSLKQSSEITDSTAGFSYNFPRIAISGGTILFSDKTLDYPFEYKIDNLRIEGKETSEMPGKIALKISAGLNGTGILKSDGIINPVDLNNDMDLALEISQFRMKDVDAYFKQYFGYPVTRGIMNFKTDNQLRTKSLESNNNIYFREFTLDQKLRTESRYNVPLRLAIGILSDKDGIIDLKAPVKMKGDEVKIKNLARIIFRVIGNLFVKAAVSPFNLLSGLYNVDPESLKEIDLGLTEISPDEKNMKSVDIIADILNDKPRLNVDFIYCVNQAKAADSLAYILAVADYMKTNRTSEASRKNIADSTLIRYLLSKPFAASLQANPGLDLLCRNFIGSYNLNVRLDSLKTNQVGFLTSYLSREREIPSERFSVIETTPDSLITDLKHPSFRIYFTAGE